MDSHLLAVPGVAEVLDDFIKAFYAKSSKTVLRYGLFESFVCVISPTKWSGVSQWCGVLSVSIIKTGWCTS